MRHMLPPPPSQLTLQENPRHVLDNTKEEYSRLSSGAGRRGAANRTLLPPPATGLCEVRFPSKSSKHRVPTDRGASRYKVVRGLVPTLHSGSPEDGLEMTLI